MDEGCGKISPCCSDGLLVLPKALILHMLMRSLSNSGRQWPRAFVGER
jgi:hypothetical protein